MKLRPATATIPLGRKQKFSKKALAFLWLSNQQEEVSVFMLKGRIRTSEKFASYLRLSIEDGDKAESNSISNQRVLVKSYTENHPDIHIVQEYVDDGYTGTNFDRPGFKKMISDIEEGKINGVIVKDLSRFGRDHIGVGKFLERIFPTIGIRFVAINDHYDSMSENSESDSMIIPFKNLLNDSYCRDISIKVRSQLDVKRKNGSFVGNYAPFGYRKSEKNKGKLEVDDYAAGVVKDIFSWKLEGCSAQRIAEKLNENGVPCPSSYKRLCGIDYHSGFKSTGSPKWQAIQVFRILQNEVYVGSLIQGKRSRINYKVKKIKDRPEEEWIKAENVHEAIIPRHTFDVVQEVLKMDTCAAPGKEQVSPFSGIVRCSDCGQNMVRRGTTSRGKRYYYLNCGTYHRGKGCSAHLISEEKLSQAVLASINEKIGQVEGLEERLSEAGQEPRDRIMNARLKDQLEMLQAEIDKYTELRSQLYRDMADNVVTKEEYEEFSKNFESHIESAKDAQRSITKHAEELSEVSLDDMDWVAELKKYKGIKTLTRRLLVELVESITVYDKAHIKIRYRFSDDLKRICDAAGIEKSEGKEVVVS